MIVTGSHDTPTGLSGHKHHLRCTEHSNKIPTKPPSEASGSKEAAKKDTVVKTGCGWHVILVEAREGYYVMRGSFMHNHAMYATVGGDANAFAGNRFIPEELKSFYDDMMGANRLGASEINSNLVSKANKMVPRIPVTWTTDDIYDATRLTAGERALDATYFVDWMKEREDTLSLKYFLHESREAGLERSFFASEGSAETWAGLGDNSVVLFDTTFATNRYGQKLGFFTTVSPHGHTVILAATFLQSESRESFEWAFSRFRDTFTSPATIFTDGCAHQARAIQSEFPEAKHMLCTFHLSKNLVTHCKKAFRNNADWEAFNSAWWGLAKDSDARSQITFAGKFRKLVDMLPEVDDDASSQKGVSTAEWMKGLYEKREQWAAAWTWAHWSAGVHSTQRCESIHKHFKAHLRANNMSIDLAKEIVDFNYNNGERLKGKTEHKRIDALCETNMVLPSLVKSLTTEVTPFAYSVVKGQYQQHTM
mmetsp:Transcript_5427/g.13778  ORF Transcript_5427/g.13778 Transcript_5427/m.13778 type:complete len:479 (+) Transcript_5427:1167-2603(+)